MKKKSFFKQFKKDIKDKREYQKVLFFLFLFIFFFSVFYLVFGKTQIANYINYFYGLLTSQILSLFGIANYFSFDSIAKISIILVPSLKEPIIISFMCSGILEFCLLSAAIFSSAGIAINKRVIGFLISVPIIVFFNLTRIVITSLIIINGNISFANFIHGFLFRTFLVIIVIGIYYFWFRINTR